MPKWTTFFLSTGEEKFWTRISAHKKGYASETPLLLLKLGDKKQLSLADDPTASSVFCLYMLSVRSVVKYILK